ncbi:homospermidine synthase [Ramlibacter sp. AW1]|uniref:Homospermidine synthase n=1 Tax=Ramlibacter aurantiacus TaxID=2801330 RepID=A0A937D7R8_9BURK|nr:saccharopine dehydrogenase C-terminal domain-containing protein [Ramlibacter aurantiacus]MBL0421236.1 homospermidine synthase [Ramlibacter aurantiacus]
MQPSDLPGPGPRDLRLPGRLVMIGLGSIGQAALPVLLQRVGVRPERITVIHAHAAERAVAQRWGVASHQTPLAPDNLDAVLEPLLAPGDFVLNLSVNVASLALVRLCRRAGAFYLDTCTEPWAGVYDNPELPPTRRSNYALREDMLRLRRELGPGPAAVMTQGANPGLVSIFAKEALLQMARETGLQARTPDSREAWASLARRLGVRVIHVAERDTQSATRRRLPDEFVNTWSVQAFIDEGRQPAELGWGSHEKHWPVDAMRHEGGCGAAIALARPGLSTRVRSWTPLQGTYHGFLVTHAESISLADYLSVEDNGALVYRPTVHYAYHPCDDAVLSIHEMAGREWAEPARTRILRDEIDGGIDELGVLLMGHPKGVYWFGSRLAIEQARSITPESNATSLQVVAGILGGMQWALRHPQAGVVEPEDLDHRLVLDVARPYLGELVGSWGEWNPLLGRGRLFDEPMDTSDPWQFVNFRVS